MSLLVRGVSQAASSGSQLSATGTIPAATQPGDLVLALVQVPSSNPAFTPPSGWAVITDLNSASSAAAGSLRGFRIIAQAGDAGDEISIALGTSTRWAMAVISVYESAGPQVKIEQTVPLVTIVQASTISTPAVTPFAAPTLLLAVISGSPNTAGAQPTITPAAGWSLRTQATSTAPALRNSVIALATKALATTGTEPAAAHTLSDSTAGTSSASIILSSSNAPPVADAGPDQTVGPGAFVTLDGGGSAWTQTSGTPVTLTGASTVTPTFTAPADVAGATLTFSLTVTDDQGGTSVPDTVTVTVAPQGSARVRVAGAWETHPLRLRADDTWL